MKRALHAALSPLAAALAMLVAGMSPQAPAFAATAAYNSAWAWIYVWATGGPSLTYSHDYLTDVTFSDDATAVGPDDPYGLHNIALAGFNYDLAHGAIGAFAQANNNRQYDWSTLSWRYYDNAAAYTGVSVADDLYFTIPAGNYPDPLKVQISGLVHGYISASGNYAAHATFKAALGNPVNPAIPAAWQLGENYAMGAHITNTALVVDELFSLEATLLKPGTNLAESKTVGLRLGMVLGDGGTISAQTPVVWPDPHVAGSAQSMFGNTLRIYDLQVPLGVTWTSSSGVFLTDIQPIPEPSVALLMTLGLLFVIVITRKLRVG